MSLVARLREWLRSVLTPFVGPRRPPGWWKQLLQPEELRDVEDADLDENDVVIIVNHHWFAHVKAGLYATVSGLAMLLAVLKMPWGGSAVIVVGCFVAAFGSLLAGAAWAQPSDTVATPRVALSTLAAAGFALAGTLAWLTTDLSGLLLLVSLGSGIWAWVDWLTVRNDTLLVTRYRVFKVTGLFSKKMAAMPLTKLVDLTVYEPWLGRFLGFGHFTFESAAQTQGLDSYRTVGDVTNLSKKIQRRAYVGPR